MPKFGFSLTTAFPLLAASGVAVAASLSGAVFGVWHNLSGAALAASWARPPVPEEGGHR